MAAKQEIKLEIQDLTKIFGRRRKEAQKLLENHHSKDEILEKTGCTVGVNKASLKIMKGEVFVVMGLSGSGKSTLLRCLNRLIEPTSGKIILDGIDITNVELEKLRQIRRTEMSMVFQHFGLLPHRTVASNVSFGLEIQGVKENECRKKALDVIGTVGLDGYEDMMTGELSGGMQQRVGLARALATDPEILLMDEAFSALDPLIRRNMQDELIDLQEKVHKTIVFITHDLDEALKLGDRIAIMKDGLIVQIGTPEDILTNPANDYVKAFVEDVDSSKVITASAIMFKHPERIMDPKDGVGLAIRVMKKNGINCLPVTDSNNNFEGYVHIDTVVKHKKEGGHTLEGIIDPEVPKCLPDTPIADLLPLVISSDLPIAVVNSKGKLEGIVSKPSVISEITGEDAELQEKMVEEE
jgi:glycine betaine/proline transport system ATP-binding protein